MTTPVVGRRKPGDPVKISIVVPCADKCHSLFAFDLANMMAFTASVMPEECEIGLMMNIGTYIHTARTELLKDALKENPTHILWLDADMRFPRDTIVRLLQRNVPFVGVNYSTRRMPPTFVGIKQVPLGANETPDGKGIRLRTDDESEGLEETDALGFGCLMMEAAALANLPDPDYIPWFWFEKTKFKQEVGEDVYFCIRMIRETLGERLFCDHDLSKQCSHIGDFEYKIYHPLTTEVALEEEIQALEADKEE